MLLDRDGAMLDELFKPSPEGQPLLEALRSDLRSAFPELDAQVILGCAQAELSGPNARKIPTDGPAIRLRAVGADGAADQPSSPVPEPPAESACIAAEARTEGWFASHAFRIARVHEAVRQLGMALASQSCEPKSCFAYALGRLKTIPGGPGAIHDCLQQAIARALEKASYYDCGRPFCPWFLQILSHAVADGFRKSVPHIDGTRDPGEEPTADSMAPMGEWVQSLIDGHNEHGIEYEWETFLLAARLELERLGIREPAGAVVERWARYGQRLYQEQTERGGAGRPPDEVPLNQYELYVAYGSHRDFRKKLAAGDPDAAALDEVEQGIGALIEFQEAKDQGEASWSAAPEGPAGPVEQLAKVQARGWGLLAGRVETDIAWMAARNLHWFSWRLKAAATLAAGLRYAERRDDSTLRPLVEALRPLHCLRTFPGKVQGALSPFRADVDALPDGPHPDAEGPALFLRAALERARLKASDGKAVAIDADFPEADWLWWSSRVTGRGRDRADTSVRRLAHRAGLIPDSLERS